MRDLHVFDHPLIRHKLTILRDRRTGHKEFRELTEELAMLMAFEATRSHPVREVDVETPLARTTGWSIAGQEIAVVPILRAGLIMENGIMRLMPTARVGHIGIYREHDTLQPVSYFVKLPPDIAERQAMILDPMLATGGSTVAAIDTLKRAGCRRIQVMAIIAAPEGIEKVHRTHPDVAIYTAAVDSHLNEKGYIVPGLGDAGDRLFGTK
ncbi:MAG: uracil phosphoribosyltransferase [Armatimonadota bacterium]|nr:uracil phosphoribosyltransferase [Armatimonadota bacterium]MDR7485004.1 uracil phosphoribosyltransferase [Armatimonadota bacterium]MDR7533695.1 uracil phosphoribosyltransferase [Armatimonadota bacterium]MDR7535518.1 uracil phosphoribosyltransferase [Armatimonadota bacterium]